MKNKKGIYIYRGNFISISTKFNKRRNENENLYLSRY